MLKMNFQNCNIKEKSKLQTKYYESKNRNAINFYFICIKPILLFKMIVLPCRKLELYPQCQKNTNDNKLFDLNLHYLIHESFVL